MAVEDSSELADRIKSDLRDRAETDSKEFIEEVRGMYLKQLETPQQGEGGLRRYVSDVEQKRNREGQFMSGFEFSVDHPTARLHEFGGPIEPTYSEAKIEGWTRDQFYEALTDCNEIVERKRLMKSAQSEAKSRFEP